MPHIEILGAGRAQDLAGPFGGFVERRPALVAKVLEAYLSPDCRRLLLEVVLVEGYLRQNFFLLVRDEEGGVLIRCHPSSPVQKTDGVKTLIALLGRRCLELHPDSRVGHTNLQSWLDRAGS